VMSYGGTETRTISLPSSESVSESLSDPSSEPVDDGGRLDDLPEFSAMTSDERLAYHRRRLANLLGP